MKHLFKITNLALCLVLIISGLFLVFPYFQVQAETISLAPIADSVVYQSSPTGNSGSKVVIEVITKPDTNQYSYIKYDLRPYAGRTVTSAKLRLMTNGDTDSGSNGLIAVKLVSDTGWSENGITYNNRPAMGTTIGSFTASNINTDYEVTLNASSVPAGSLFSLGLSNPANDQATFHSRETSNYPELVLTFAAAVPTPTRTPTPTPTRTPTPTPTTPPTTTVSHTPVADAATYENSPSSNFGTSLLLEGGTESPSSSISYLKFDLSSHAGRMLTAARLRLRTHSNTNSYTDQSVNIRLVSDTTWTETGITWNNKPPVSSTNLATFFPSAIGTTYDTTLNASLLQGSVGGLLTIAVFNPSADRVEFHSRETTFVPELILTFTAAPTPTAGGPVSTPTPTTAQPTSGVVLDNQTNSDGFTSWLHTTSNNTNRLLLVSVRSTGSAPGSVRYNNVNLTLLRSAQPLSTGVGTDPENYPVTSVWYMVNPPVGTYTVSVPTLVQGGSATFYNVNQNSPFGTTAVSFADRNNVILTSYIVSSGVPPSSNGQLVYSALSIRTRSGGFTSIAPASGQTPMYNSDNSQFHAMSTKPAAIGSNTPMGWIMTNPNGTFDWAGVAVGINMVPGLIPPTPTSAGSPPTPTPTPPGNGNVINVNFGVSSFTPWIQGICGSMRLDNGVSNPIPGTAADGAYMIRTGTNCTTPSIVYAGAGPVSMGAGQASTSNWQVGGSQYPEVYSGTRLLTSYATLTNKVQRGQVATTSLSTICALSSCTLPANLPSGVYTALGNVTLSGFTTPVNRDYIFLINGNLTMQDAFIIPQGSNSTSLFTASGDIVIGPNVGTAVNAPQTSLDGWYSADNSIIINSNNDCTDLRLNVGGALITNAARQSGTLQNNRDLCNNDTTYPALTITQRLDMILNAPEFLSQQSVISNEVAP